MASLRPDRFYKAAIVLVNPRTRIILSTSHRLKPVRSRTADEKTILQRQIDTLVYQLYNLTEEEIAIVEESVS